MYSENSEICSFGILWVAGYSLKSLSRQPVEQRGQEYWLSLAARKVSDINVLPLFFIFVKLGTIMARNWFNWVAVKPLECLW